ncbi:Crp/Fnr family transcriptional regulator [Sunxiuqinia sp. A32]|uniref:Crp/Fnr family transcriptional regulator n=1 Tax=Sunxiuqinia sp. A32 TaxID=3461496 RepID=UPI004045649D
MFTNLIHSIQQHIDLDEKEISILCNYIDSHQLKKKDFLLKEGDVCHDLFFVEKGCLRMYFIDERAVEQITQFAIDRWWMSDYFSFMDRTPSEYYIQAVEKSEILSISHTAFEEMLKELPKMERYLRISMQRALAASQLRIKYMYELTKEEFYIHFSTSFPEFMQRVPQYMIASYLGLTPEYVSELRKKHL